MDKHNFDPAEISNGRTSSNERMENVPLLNIPRIFSLHVQNPFFPRPLMILKIDMRLGSKFKFLSTNGGTGELNQA